MLMEKEEKYSDINKNRPRYIYGVRITPAAVVRCLYIVIPIN